MPLPGWLPGWRSIQHCFGQNWAMTIPGAITELADLEGRFRQPGDRARSKVFDRIDAASARFIDLCPFVVLSTTNGTSIDASPRGGPPGFIRRIDDHHLAIPDLVGNNRLDSYRNIISHGQAGLLLMIPGRDETLRINGEATLSDDPDLLGSFTQELRRPKLALIIRTDELYGHCAKALRRSGLWQPDSWASMNDAPDLADIYACQFEGIEATEMRSVVEKLYSTELAGD